MPRPPKILFFLSVIVLILFICVGAGYLWFLNSFSLDFLKPADCLYKTGNTIDPKWFKSFALIDLPQSATNVSATCEVWQDYVAHARFTIDPSDVNSLIASSITKLPLSTTEKPGDMLSHISELTALGWDVDSITSFLASEASDMKRGFHQSILIDTSNPDQYVIYVVTYSI